MGPLEAPDLRFRGPCPIDDLPGRAAVAEKLWTPLAAAFTGLRRQTDILLSGRFAEADWIATSGHFTGVFDCAWLGIEPTQRIAFVRFGRIDRIDNEQIVETLLLLDIPSLMLQAGQWPLAVPPGPNLMAPGPWSQDGLEERRESGAQSLALVEAMIGGLRQFDGSSLSSMGMPGYWKPDFRWYGPGPIGSFGGHADYERGHQGPFLRAFPDRIGGNHVCRIGEGPYVASGGWPSVRATHSGDGWLGLKATGRPVGMRVMDFWRRDGDRLTENWVMIDIPDVLRQLGIDLFASRH